MIERVIDLTRLPQMVEQDGQFPGHRNHGSSFCVLTTAFGKLEAPTAKIAVRTEGPEDILSRTDKQSTQVAVSGLGNSQLRVMIPGLVTFWYETKCRTDLAALLEAAWLFKGEDVG